MPAGDEGTVSPFTATRLTGGGVAPSSAAAADGALTSMLAAPQAPDEIGRLGHYRVLRVLGAGGMGVVFQAEDLHLRRPVALKVMLPALAARSARQRFLREARAMAAVKHDHVVTIYQVDEDHDVPFLAMELLEGESLEDRLKRERPAGTVLPLPEVLRIGREVAEGLAAAHARDLIHRDIKPGNVWLETTHSPLSPRGRGVGGEGGRVKVLDFGLARAGAVVESNQITRSGVLVGTPAFMAPEQARGDKVDGRSDLFSLGCVLYRMTTGQLPFGGTEVISVLMALANDEPPAPQTINPGLPQALSDLIVRLLAKRPQDRPASAQAVAEALATLERAISADATTIQQAPPARRRSRRKWVALAALLGAALLAAGALIYVKTDTGVLEIETADADVKVVVEQDGKQVRVIDLKTNKQITLRSGKYQIKTDGREDLELDLHDVDLRRGGKIIARIRRRPHDAIPVAKAVISPPPVPPDEPVGEVRRYLGHTGQVNAVAVTRDGKYAVSGGVDTTVRVWDVATGREVRRYAGHHEYVWSVAVSPDGRSVLSGGGGSIKDGKRLAGSEFALCLWDLGTAAMVRRFEGHTGGVNGVAFSPDGRHAISGGCDATLILWDVASGKEIRRFRGHRGWVQGVVWSPDGKTVLSSGWDGTLRLWDVETGHQRRVFAGHTDVVFDAAFSPDGQFALSGSGDRTVRLWDVASGKEVRRLPEHPTAVRSVAFSPDGRRVLSGSGVLPCDSWPSAGFDSLVRLWDVETGKELHRFRGQRWAVTSIACVPGGYYALSGGVDYTVRLWRLPDKGAAPTPQIPSSWDSLYHADTKSLSAWLERMRIAGYRPKFINGHAGDDGTPRFTAFALRGGRDYPWEARYDLDQATFQDAFEDLSARGYRPVSTTGYADHGKARFASLWVRDGRAGKWEDHNALTEAEFKEKFAGLKRRHIRPAQLKAYNVGDSCRLAALFEEDNGIPWVAEHRLTPEACVVFLREWREKGYRLVSASTYQDGGQPYLTAVMLQDNQRLQWIARYGLSAAALRKEDDHWTSRQYRPLLVSAYLQGKETRYLAVWVQDEFAELPLPRSGAPVAALAGFDRAMQQFMHERFIHAGALAVVKDGKVLLSRSYGWQDRAQKLDLLPGAPLRLGGLSTLFTAAAMHKLIAAGKLRLDTKVVSVLAIEPPPGQKRDPRWDDLTIGHLLAHQGGWDNTVADDPLLHPTVVAAALGKAGPVTAEDVIRYMAGRPLQVAPGSKTTFSNFGYCLLGRVIEKVSGQTYLDYLQKEILVPLGIKGVELGRTAPDKRNPREPYYSDSERGRSVLPEDGGATVFAPDGLFRVEALDAAGGLVAPAADVARFLSAYQVDGRPAGKGAAAGCVFGNLPGTFTVAIQRPDNVRIVALFNQRSDPSGKDYFAIRKLLEAAADSVRHWTADEVKRPAAR